MTANLDLPWTESPFFEGVVKSRCRTGEEEEQARAYRRDGYLILRGAVPDGLVERIQREAGLLFRPGVADGPRSAYRVQDGWKESPAVRELAASPRVLDTLRFLYGKEAFPFQTLNFLHGSQQRAHSDSIHFSARPARFMCGAWAALEDITPENGPLFYYPGSQRLPEYNYYDMGMSVKAQDYRRYEDFIEGLMAAHGFEKVRLSARKGDVLIWSSNLVHGGEKILKAGSTRWSQVTHYYFRDCLYYTPMLSNFLTGEICHREVRDVRTARFVEQTYNGRSVAVIPSGRGLYRVKEDMLWLGKAVSAVRRGLSHGKRLLLRARPGKGSPAGSAYG